MNNGRDFVDLDKAVKAQQAKKPIAVGGKPNGSKGRYMDIVNPRSKVRPLTQRTTRPMQELVAQKPVDIARKPEPTKPQPVEEKPIEKTEAPRPSLFQDESSKVPNADNYSLGGRSPFLLADAKVDKRPLGKDVPESNAGAIRSTKNVYSQKTPLRSGESQDLPGRTVITVSAPKKKSGWLWAVITLGVIVAGGGVGLLAYLIFANQ
ncbi:MAG: hypothetical protein LBT19_02320 [Candidatus Nomurabacteria bacterium]|jgi:hypothetical protein|nr:hypothetical protein [Candidatus Nomurabacteria bacterium]